MRHLRTTSLVQLPLEKKETLKSSHRGPSLRVLVRHGMVFICFFLLASYVLGVIVKPLYKLVDPAIVIQESVGQLNSSKLFGVDRYGATKPSGLNIMEGKNVILVSHELSLSGGPLLLMELGFLLQKSGAHVYWVTGNRKEMTSNPVVIYLEDKLVNHGLQILPAKGTRTVQALTTANLVILNTAVAGKWIDSVLKTDVKKVLSRTLWWIHETRGHYFALEYVKHLPEVAGVMIDSHAGAEYWRTRTRERLRFTLPKIHVVHLGISQQLMSAAEDAVGRKSMRQHVRQILGFHDNDIVFAMINSVSRGKGQDLFLRAFVEAVNLVKKMNVTQQLVFEVHALLVGSDWAAPAYELMLRNFVKDNDLGSLVHFVNKSMDIVPYLAAADVLVQNSQGRGECFGRITIEAMAFRLPVLGTSAGGTLEIVVNGSTGLLHPVGKEGVHVLAESIRDLALNSSIRINMGSRGYHRVKEQFMEYHMCNRLRHVLQTFFSRTL